MWYKVLKIKFCAVCGGEYLARPWQKYCHKCAISVEKEQKKQWHLKYITKGGYGNKICQNCYNEYTPTNSTQKYCQTCGPIVCKEHARQKDKDDYAKKIKTGWREKYCKKCENIFKPNSGFQLYCSYCGDIIHKEQVKRVMVKCKSKRRQLDSILLNNPSEGNVAHHVTKNEILYIPKEIHQSISHNIWTGENMDEINFLAYKFFIGHGNDTISSE